MAQYKVLSARFTGGKVGSLVDSDALEGCNIEALVSGGHIAEVPSKSTKPESTEDK
jgi:hypothetical protein